MDADVGWAVCSRARVEAPRSWISMGISFEGAQLLHKAMRRNRGPGLLAGAGHVGRGSVFGLRVCVPWCVDEG